MPMTHPTRALVGARIFDGERLLNDHAVILEDDTIAGVVPLTALADDMPLKRHDGGILAPGFIDAQINGAGGVLFNEAPTRDTLVAMIRAQGKFGTTAMLPTFITDRPEIRAQAIAAVREAIAVGVPGIVGIHLEGPFLSPKRKGAHALDLIADMTASDVEALTSTGLVTVLLTLAPERVDPALIARLVVGGVIVSLGHTEATFDQAMAAVAAGARGVTHLFNAMSQLGNREPGMVGAALAAPELHAGIIADGVHVHPTALRLALAAKTGRGRLFLVTDAMPPSAGGGDSFALNGRTATRSGPALVLEDGTLAGSDLTMHKAVRYVVHELGVDLSEALRMASLYPAEFLRLSDTRGRLKQGYRADIVHLSDTLEVTDVLIGGRPFA